ncbi:MAG: glycosyltransferase [Bacteroides intestinalis]|nr:glycosyltransferase [Bacteroides intestinalis]
MDDLGLVSIITPTYNCAQYIGETIDSVISQTYIYWEMIIVDDCSSDDTEEIVSKYQKQDARIKYYRLIKNSGAAVARTMAMRMATGEYMAFLDSDDLWMPNKLSVQLEFMIKNGYAFTCTSYVQVNESGNVLNRVVHTVRRINYNRLLLDCPVGNSTVMYNVSKMGKFEVPDLRKRNDDALWLKMLRVEPYIWGIPNVLMKYRICSNSISVNKFSLIKYHWYLYREIEHLNLLRSAFHVFFWCFLKVFRIK